jgi:hypothetical protein
MHKKILALIVLSLSLALTTALVVAPRSTLAQTSLTLSRVKVSLWPEFDRSAMLVIYRLTLPPQTTLPAEMSVRIPASTGSLNAVAASHPDGSLLSLTYSLEDEGEWTRVVFQATTPEVQFEYYDNSLTKEGAARHFEYHWPGDYAVNSFVIEIQQPVGASEMRISPSLGAGVPAADGLTYFTSEVGPLTQGQSFTITLDYQKPDNSLSQDSVSVAPSAPLVDSDSGSNWSSLLPYLLGGLGILLLGGGAYWYWRSGQQESPQTRRKRGARKRAAVRSEPVSEASGHVYCHQCGKRAAPGDRFCRACGTQLRIS